MEGLIYRFESSGDPWYDADDEEITDALQQDEEPARRLLGPISKNRTKGYFWFRAQRHWWYQQ